MEKVVHMPGSSTLVGHYLGVIEELGSSLTGGDGSLLSKQKLPWMTAVDSMVVKKVSHAMEK